MSKRPMHDKRSVVELHTEPTLDVTLNHDEQMELGFERGAVGTIPQPHFVLDVESGAKLLSIFIARQLRVGVEENEHILDKQCREVKANIVFDLHMLANSGRGHEANVVFVKATHAME